MASFDNAIRITAVGTTQVTGGASARVTIPVTAAGTAPRYIRIAALAEAYIKVGDSTVAATTNDIMLQPGDSLILTAQGCTHIAFIQGTLSTKVSVTPLEDQ